jgi:hypothetical protein
MYITPKKLIRDELLKPHWTAMIGLCGDYRGPNFRVKPLEKSEISNMYDITLRGESRGVDFSGLVRGLSTTSQ